MQKFLWLVLISLLLGGCNSVPTEGVNANQQVTKYDRRSPETIASDTAIEQTADEELAGDQDDVNQSHVNVNVYNGLALVTGEVINAELKNKVIDTVRVIPNVKMVRDSLNIAKPSDMISRVNDKHMTEQIKTALTQIHTLPNFDSSMIKVVTENSSVYLMGQVSRAEGTVVINVTRLQPYIKQIVTVFEYLD